MACPIVEIEVDNFFGQCAYSRHPWKFLQWNLSHSFSAVSDDIKAIKRVSAVSDDIKAVKKRIEGWGFPPSKNLPREDPFPHITRNQSTFYRVSWSYSVNVKQFYIHIQWKANIFPCHTTHFKITIHKWGDMAK